MYFHSSSRIFGGSRGSLVKRSGNIVNTGSCDFKSIPTTLPPPGCMLCAERPQSIHNRAQPPPARAADARELLDDRGDQLLRDVLQDVRGPAAAAKQPRRPEGGSEHFAGSVFDTF